MAQRMRFVFSILRYLYLAMKFNWIADCQSNRASESMDGESLLFRAWMGAFINFFQIRRAEVCIDLCRDQTLVA
jgi:hypothetical protein